MYSRNLNRQKHRHRLKQTHLYRIRAEKMHLLQMMMHRQIIRKKI